MKEIRKKRQLIVILILEPFGLFRTQMSTA